MKQLPTEQDNTQEIDIAKVFSILWSQKIIIASVVCIFAISGIVYALSIPNRYYSQATLTSSSSEGGGLGALADSLGGLASIAGVINLGSGNNNLDEQAVQVIQSWGFIEDFIAKRQIKVPLFAAKSWNKKINELVIDEDLYDSTQQKWLREPNKGKKAEPSSWELYGKFSELFSINIDLKTGFISMSMQFYSPYLAAKWLEWLIEDINQEIRKRKLLEIENNIKYLTEQINLTNKSELQSVFYSLIEEQLKAQMLANANPDFVFKILNRPMVAEVKSSPKRALIVVIFTFLGGVFSSIYILFKHRQQIII